MKERYLETKYMKSLYNDDFIDLLVLAIKGRPQYEPEYLTIQYEGFTHRVPLDIITKALKDYEIELKNR